MNKLKRILSAALAAAMMLGSISVSASLDDVNYIDWSNKWFTDTEDTSTELPAKYSFTLDDDTADIWKKTPIYQVLDTETVDGKKNVLIMRLNAVAARATLTNDAECDGYDPTETGSLAYWMNNVWTGDAASDSSYNSIIDVVGSTLNPKLKKYLVEHKWTMEQCNSAGTEKGTITAKAVIPSASELNHYVPTKINADSLSTGMGQSASLTRTLKGKTDTGVKRIVFAGGRDATSSKKTLSMAILNINTSEKKRAWGMFWVSEDFFKNVKINVEDMGSEVISLVTSLNTVDELYALGYTLGELVKMGVVEPPAEPVASNISISANEALPGYPVTVKYSYSHEDDEKEGDTKIYWYVSDSENGTYTKVSGAEGNNWSIQNVCADKYLKAKVVPVTAAGIEATADYFSKNAIKVGSALRAFNPDAYGGWGLPSDMPSESPAEYKFALENPSNAGFTYHMLDTKTENGESSFFILQMGSMISNGRMTSDAENYRFDPSVKYSVAGWLNDVWAVSATPGQSEYYNTGGNGPLNNNATAIDTNIKQYLVTNTWRTESSGGTFVPNDFTFDAKVALLSVSEFFEHYKKFGKDDYGRAWLRTSTEHGGKAMYYLLNTDSNVWAKNGGSESNIHKYRPVYYLSADFFKDVRLDKSSVGSEVAKMIRSVISKDEMLGGKAGYTEAEVNEIFGYPEKTGFAENVVVSGNIAVGEKVMAKYDFNKNGLDKNEGSATRFQWYRTDKKDGKLEIITGADKKEYTVSEADLGKYLAVKVTPVNEESEICKSATGKTAKAVKKAMDFDIEFVGLSDGVKTIDKAEDTENLTASFKITNEASAVSMTLIIAVYDSDNEMVGWNSNTVSVKNGTDNYSVTVSGLDSAKSYVSRVMVVDSMTALRPLYAETL